MADDGHQLPRSYELLSDSGPLPNPYGELDDDLSDSKDSDSLSFSDIGPYGDASGNTSGPASIPYNPSHVNPWGIPVTAGSWAPWPVVPNRRSPPPRNAAPGLDDEVLATLPSRVWAHLEIAAQYANAALADLGFRQGWEGDTLRPMESTVSPDDPSFQTRPWLWEKLSERSPSLKDPMGDWPARLLHVPTMTSLPWQAGNEYGGQKEPPYAIISYTWGRWRLPSDHDPPHPALQVHGITWKVPPVKDALFSVDEFERALRKVSKQSSCDLVWVDIACINQNNGSPESAREVGRQAKIFRTAHQAFIWLVNQRGEGEAPVETLMRDLQESARLANWAHRRWAFDHTPSGYEDEHLVGGSTDRSIGSADDNAQRVSAASMSIATLTAIPWFTSLWTLQEGFLRPTSRFINRHGDYALSGEGTPFSLQDLLTYSRQFHQILAARTKLRLDEPSSPGDNNQFLKMGLIRVIERAGLEALADRDRLSLYACSYSRKASNPHDRIYGIMQVWDFQLGKSAPQADPARSWTVGELEFELGKRLIEEFPVESQLMVHSGMHPTCRRQGWRVAQSSAIPLHGLLLSPTGRLDGILDRPSHLGLRKADGVTYVWFQGMSCEFEDLRLAWEAAYNRGDEQTPSSPVRISLDFNPVLNARTMQTRFSLQDVPQPQQLELAAIMSGKMKTLGRTLSVLLLGAVTQQSNGVGRTTCIGLIVADAPDEVIGGWKKRLGICLWVVPPSGHHHESAALSGQSEAWHQVECLVG